MDASHIVFIHYCKKYDYYNSCLSLSQNLFILTKLLPNQKKNTTLLENIISIGCNGDIMIYSTMVIGELPFKRVFFFFYC